MKNKRNTGVAFGIRKAKDNDLKEVLEAISTYAEMQADYIKDNWQVENYKEQIILYGLSGT